MLCRFDGQERKKLADLTVVCSEAMGMTAKTVRGTLLRTDTPACLATTASAIGTLSVLLGQILLHRHAHGDLELVWNPAVDPAALRILVGDLFEIACATLDRADPSRRHVFTLVEKDKDAV